MENSKKDRQSLFRLLREKLSNYSSSEIEVSIMDYCLVHYGIIDSVYHNDANQEIINILYNNDLPCDLENIIEIFEALNENDKKDENGIVFTPKYIADFIAKETFRNVSKYETSLSIIDPGCGCGIFLVSAIEYLSYRFNVSVDDIIQNNIYGIDIDSDNARRCILVLKLLSAQNNGDYSKLHTNILCHDSLKIDWCTEFKTTSFDFVIGNPPYVNPHDMNKDTVLFLKRNFSTTKNGVFNIFYAFIEHSLAHLNSKGALGFIVPNNFLTIKSALDLRQLLQTNECLDTVIDFADNMVFKPIRTYNCILLLTNNPQKSFRYYVMDKTDSIESSLNSIHYSSMPIDKLDKNGWKLVDSVTQSNLEKIESNGMPIKSFIRTGIATLRDGVYLVNCDKNGFYKTVDNSKVYIENDLVKPIYKVPELKTAATIDDAKRYIIFPYIKTSNGYTLISEDELSEKYPQTYKVLLSQRTELDARDKGKGAAQGWFAYGRTQGLNKYGKKLLFPTFASTPRFTYVENEDALFCNGYAVFENDFYELDVLQKLLNSKIMEYYVANTSYSIEGGYYCYQKKYIEKFTLPCFSSKELDYIRSAPKPALDEYLWSLYGLE